MKKDKSFFDLNDRFGEIEDYNSLEIKQLEDLIEGCIRINPSERFTIDEIIFKFEKIF